MGLAKRVNNAERDFLQEMEEAKVVDSLSMQHYVNKMGTQNEFTAAEVAGILGYTTSEPVYALADSGALEGLNRGTGARRYLVVPRVCLLKYLKAKCKDV